MCIRDRRGAVEDSLIEALGGELFLDGEKLKPVGVRLLKREPEKTVLQMTLTEGKNRQIRRMCEQVGVEVIRLKRVSEGGIRLAGLKSGHWRQMTAQEVAPVSYTHLAGRTPLRPLWRFWSSRRAAASACWERGSAPRAPKSP